MKPQGVIYQASSGAQPNKHTEYAEVFISLPSKIKNYYSLARTLGVVLVYLAVSGFLFFYKDAFSKELSYQKSQLTKAHQKQDKTKSSDLEVQAHHPSVQEEAEFYGVDSKFSIFIPKIEAKSVVFPNVDITNAQEYLSALEEGVAHAKATAFPGEDKTVFLFAHSTDESPLNVSKYNAVFYLLRKLEQRDQIIVFYKNEKFVYEVTEKIVVDPKDVSWLNKDYGEERLILQTCDPPATTLRRLLVIAKPV